MVKLTFDRAKKTLVSAAVIPVCLSASAMPVHADTPQGNADPAPIVKMQSESSGAVSTDAAQAETSENTKPQAQTETENHAQENLTTGAAESTVQTTPAKQDAQEEKTAGDQILGEARNYGIVCDNYTQTFDAETNIAAKTAKTNPGQHTGNDLTARKDQTYMIGKINGSFGIKGKEGGKATVITPDAKGTGLYDGTYTVDSSKTEQEIDKKIEQLKQSALQRLDTALITAQETTIKEDSNTGKWCLDISEKSAGTYKVSIKDKNIIKNAGDLDIKISADNQTVILSVDDSLIPENGTLDFASYNINGVGSASYNTGAYGDKPAKAIIWDFRNSNLKTINIGTSSGNWINGSSNGIFIAPNADIYLNSTSSGWIICKDMHVEYGEWHNIDQSTNPALPEDNPTTPGKDNTGGGKGESETVKPGDEGKNKDKQDTPKPDAGETGKPSDSGKTDKPSVENPDDHKDGGHSETGSTTGKETNPEDSENKDGEKQDGHNQGAVTPSDNTNPSTPDTKDETGNISESGEKGDSVHNTSEKTDTNNSNTGKSSNTDPAPKKETNTKHTGKNKEKISKSEIDNKNANPKEQVHKSKGQHAEKFVNTSSKAYGSTNSAVKKENETASYGAMSTGNAGPATTAPDSEASVTAGIPKTGDHSSLLLYSGLFAASAAALALVLLKLKKSK